MSLITRAVDADRGWSSWFVVGGKFFVVVTAQCRWVVTPRCVTFCPIITITLHCSMSLLRKVELTNLSPFLEKMADNWPKTENDYSEVRSVTPLYAYNTSTRAAIVCCISLNRQ